MCSIVKISDFKFVKIYKPYNISGLLQIVYKLYTNLISIENNAIVKSISVEYTAIVKKIFSLFSFYDF